MAYTKRDGWTGLYRPPATSHSREDDAWNSSFPRFAVDGTSCMQLKEMDMQQSSSSVLTPPAAGSQSEVRCPNDMPPVVPVITAAEKQERNRRRRRCVYNREPENSSGMDRSDRSLDGLLYAMIDLPFGDESRDSLDIGDLQDDNLSYSTKQSAPFLYLNALQASSHSIKSLPRELVIEASLGDDMFEDEQEAVMAPPLLEKKPRSPRRDSSTQSMSTETDLEAGSPAQFE